MGLPCGMGKTPSKEAEPAKRGRGRPPSPTAKREQFQFRATKTDQEPWRKSAEAMHQDNSDWARNGLDAWVTVCDRARDLGVNPQDLIKAALEDHARVRAAVAELLAARSPMSKVEARVLRVLAPLEATKKTGSD